MVVRLSLPPPQPVPGPMPATLGRELVQELGDLCGVAGIVARVALARPSGSLESFRLAGLQGTQLHQLDQVLSCFQRRLWLVVEGQGWRRGRLPIPASLADFLDGAAAMRRHGPQDLQADLVITRPRADGHVLPALLEGIPAHLRMVPTEEVFERLASTAQRSFTMMMPFVNAAGLDFALRLYGLTMAEERVLILRRRKMEPGLLERYRPLFMELQVSLLDYHPEVEGGGFETFHAKVVMADETAGYIGSANLTLFERPPLELGVALYGRAMGPVADLMRGIRQVATPF